MTEIGVSALSLNQTRQTRMERMAAGEGEEGDGDVDVEGEGPIPKYPRGMLRFELSDGATTLQAIEYRTLPELTLGVTQLGYKVGLHHSIVAPYVHLSTCFILSDVFLSRCSSKTSSSAEGSRSSSPNV